MKDEWEKLKWEESLETHPEFDIAVRYMIKHYKPTYEEFQEIIPASSYLWDKGLKGEPGYNNEKDCGGIKLHCSLNPKEYREHLFQYHNYDYPMEECLNEED